MKGKLFGLLVVVGDYHGGWLSFPDGASFSTWCSDLRIPESARCIFTT